MRKISNTFKESASESFRLDFYYNFPESSKINSGNFNVLILHEPRSVIPWQYKTRVLSQFQMIIPFSPWRSELLGLSNWTYYPYKFSGLSYSSGVKRDIWISMINAAKFSSGVSSNYGLRRKVSKLLDEQGVDFRLYGWDWNSSYLDELKRRAFALRNSLRAQDEISWTETFSTLFYRFKAYKGGISDKSEILQRSQLTLIIENDSDYITEKLFDAFTFRAVPIYVGPSFERYLTDLEKCIIRCERKASAVIERIRSITPAEVNSKRLEIDKLMMGGTLIKELESEQVWEKIGEMVISQISKH